jgi:hypothetical protein
LVSQLVEPIGGKYISSSGMVVVDVSSELQLIKTNAIKKLIIFFIGVKGLYKH